MRVDNSTGKSTSGMDKFRNKVHRVHMELGDNNHTLEPFKELGFDSQ
jgi:hypothetical protein